MHGMTSQMSVVCRQGVKEAGSGVMYAVFLWVQIFRVSLFTVFV